MREARRGKNADVDGLSFLAKPDIKGCATRHRSTSPITMRTLTLLCTCRQMPHLDVVVSLWVQPSFSVDFASPVGPRAFRRSNRS